MAILDVPVCTCVASDTGMFYCCYFRCYRNSIKYFLCNDYVPTIQVVCFS